MPAQSQLTIAPTGMTAARKMAEMIVQVSRQISIIGFDLVFFFIIGRIGEPFRVSLPYTAYYTTFSRENQGITKRGIKKEKKSKKV